MPGLIDAHSHGRGLPPSALDLAGAPLERFILRLAAASDLPPVEDHLLAAAELLGTGITTAQVVFHTTRPRCLYAERVRAVAAAWRASGVRFELVLGFTDIAGVLPDGVTVKEVPDPRARILLERPEELSARDYLAVADELAGETVGAVDEGQSRIALGPVAPQWASEEVWPGLVARARAGVRVHVHLLETARQRPPYLREHPRRRLARVGLPAGCLSVAHAVWVDEDDMAWLAGERVVVVHNPASNLRLDSGTAAVRELLDAGVTVALGLDSNAIDDPPDIFSELRLARALAAERGGVLRARELFAMATQGGASAVGRVGELGVLVSGARADIVLLDPEWMAAGEDPFTALVDRGEREHVHTVLVGGRAMLQDHRAVSAAEAATARRRLLDSAAADVGPRTERLAALARIEDWLLERWGVPAVEASAA